MKLFNLSIALAFSLTLAAGMGSKSKPASPMEDPKILPESTQASTPQSEPIELIENTQDDNQKVEKDLDKSTAPTETSEVSKKTKKAKKTKAPAAKKKKVAPAPAKKSSAKPSKKPKIK